MLRVLLFFLGALSLGSVSPAQDLKQVLSERLGRHPGAGIVVGILDEQGLRAYITAGHAGEKGVPLDANTVFEIGSVSKVFTATLLADMVRRGDVQLDDPVAKYLPASVRVPERNGKSITLGTLCAHTSGLPRMPDNFRPKDADNPYADYTVEQMYEFISRYQLTRDIGERFEYSNLGVGLLGHALALRSGKSYEQLLRERITGPLAMKDTRIALDAGLSRRLAPGYTANGYPTSNWDIPTLAGAGAIRSTAADILTFLAAQLAAPKGPLGAAMADTQVPLNKADRPGMEAGLGWMIRTNGDTRIVWHNGGTGGYHSFVGFNPARRIAVVVLHNSAASIDDIGFHLLDSSLPLDATAKPLQVPKATVALPPSTLEGLVGKYVLSPAFVIDVTADNGQLFIQATGQQKLPVYPSSDTTFFLKVVDAQITFERDAAGRTVALVLHQNGLDQRAKKQ